MQTALQSWRIERIKPQDGIDADSAAELDRGADGTAGLDKQGKPSMTTMPVNKEAIEMYNRIQD